MARTPHGAARTFSTFAVETIVRKLSADRQLLTRAQRLYCLPYHAKAETVAQAVFERATVSMSRDGEVFIDIPNIKEAMK